MHPTQQFCATVSDDKTLRVWDLRSDHRMVSYKILKQAGRSVGFSSDGKFLAVGLKDGKILHIFNVLYFFRMVAIHDTELYSVRVHSLEKRLHCLIFFSDISVILHKIIEINFR